MSIFQQQPFHATPAERNDAEGFAPVRLWPNFTGDVSWMAGDDSSAEEAPDSGGVDAGLEDAVQDEHEYLRQRLRDELGREPSEEELNEWLRQHTEGY